MLDHERIYVHGNGRLVVAAEERPCPVPGARDSTFMWSTCTKCQCCTALVVWGFRRTLRASANHLQRTKLPAGRCLDVRCAASPVVSMSEAAWKCSVGKYMELSFHDATTKLQLEQCDHSLYRDHRRYFALADLAVSFTWEAVPRYEIVPPPIKLQVRLVA